MYLADNLTRGARRDRPPKIPTRHSNEQARERPNRLAEPMPIERTWCPDHDAQLAALRVVLGLPRRPVVLDKEET